LWFFVTEKCTTTAWINEPVVNETKVRLKLMRQFRGTEGFGNLIFDGHSSWKTLAENLLTQVAKLEGDTTEHRITLPSWCHILLGLRVILNHQIYNNVTRAPALGFWSCVRWDATTLTPMLKWRSYSIDLGFVTTVSQHTHILRITRPDMPINKLYCVVTHASTGCWAPRLLGNHPQGDSDGFNVSLELHANCPRSSYTAEPDFKERIRKEIVGSIVRLRN